jgi:membrane-associated phospholipid phosphatase
MSPAGQGQWSPDVQDRYRQLPRVQRAPGFALVGLALLAPGLLLAVVITLDSAWMNARDLGANIWFADVGLSNGFVNQLADWLSWIGTGERTLRVVIVVAALLVMTRHWRWAVFVVVVSQTGALVSTLIKHTVGRQRPPLGDFDASQLTSSFPSGHTFAGITTWVAIGIVVLYVFPRPWATLLAVVPIAIGIANGPSRLILTRHWVSDVLGAWLLASGWLLIVWAAFVWWMALHAEQPCTELPADPSGIRPDEEK